ncbi:MAG: hypothetical protein ACYTGW_21555 [Planctomycetota bacterium]|jgi:hypothetical protein
MKLPINPLLYLVSLACAGGIVLNIMGTVKPRTSYDPKQVEPRIRDDVKKLVEQGGKVLPDIGQYRYDPTDPFWEQFKNANFTGYRAPEPVAVDPVQKSDVAQGALDVNLSEKIVVICISYGGDYTRAVVQYLDQVEVPEEHQTSNSAPAAVAPLANPGGRGRRPPPTLAPQVTSTVPTHHVDLGQHLWKPYDNFYLVEVAEDARSVFFENRGKPKVEDKFPRQELLKNELGLPEDVAKKLVDDARRRAGATGTANRTTPESQQPAVSKWQDVPETKAIRENEWIVSRNDLGYINQRGNRFIHEDVHLRDYSGGSGKTRVQGVSVHKLGKQVRGLGVSEGDILISLNGIPVKTRAQAIRVGKRLWRDGVRSFKAVFLRRGRQVTMTHHFPHK